MYLREFQEKASEFQEKVRAGMVAFRRKRRHGNNVGQFGPLKNYYDACFFAFRRALAPFKKMRLCIVNLILQGQFKSQGHMKVQNTGTTNDFQQRKKGTIFPCAWFLSSSARSRRLLSSLLCSFFNWLMNVCNLSVLLPEVTNASK